MFSRTSGIIRHLRCFVKSSFFRCASRNTRVQFLPTHEQLSSRISPISALPSLIAARYVSSETENVHQPQESTFASGANQNATLDWEAADMDLRIRVLESAISFVPIHGWSRQSVEAACQADGLPSGLHTLAMPQGPIDLVLHFYASRNQRLADTMTEWNVTASPQTRPSPGEVDEFLYRALKYRLEQNIPVINEWPQALGLLALPSNLPSSVGLLAQLVDEVWAQAGDRSTDMTWYAKRLGLAYVYNLAEVYMLQDKSPEYENSWVFLRSRLADLRSIKQMNLKAVSSMVRDGVVAFGNVTCNILRLSRRR